MKITKELLEHLKLKSITIRNGQADTLCFLERIEKEIWTFSLPEKIEFQQGEQTFLQVNFHEEEGSVLKAKILDFGEDWCELQPEVETTNTRLKTFLTMLSGMEEKYESFGRRKEERIKIGKERFGDFGLSSLKQNLFLQGVNMIQPCVVLDASVHGICIITMKTPAVQKEENFCIKLDFSEPNESIILKAHKVYTRLNKTEDKIFATLSCQLLEPIHFAYKNRVISMIEKEP
jgi:hypothetical protein